MFERFRRSRVPDMMISYIEIPDKSSVFEERKKR